MIRDLRLHGSIGSVDFFAFIAGASTYNSYFYDEGPSSIRFFSKGNEFTITEDGIRYKGTGGSFCEYMFGVEKPVKDMEKHDVLNRLIMFGAFLDDREQVVFTNNTEGSDTFYRLFLQGHAVNNYYFIISSEFPGDYRKRQQHILRLVGKFLKRTDVLSGDQDTKLLGNFLQELHSETAVVFIFKLINRGNREYYDAFRSFYMTSRVFGPQEELALEEIVQRNQIDRYQQERMNIDIMYRHPENKVIVDEYRDILIAGFNRETLLPSELARLNRLRTLSIRNTIPVVLFDKLDELLLMGKQRYDLQEQEYLKDARAILENLFFKDPSLKQHIIQEDIIRLIRAKHTAYAQNDRGFEQILLDVGKACDEISREREEFSIFEEFSAIVTYFDRYDNVQSLLNQISFMKNIEFREESLRSLIGNKKAFDELDAKLFQSCFVDDLLENRYVTNYGKRKIQLITRGMDSIQSGEATFRTVIGQLEELTDEEKLYNEIHTALKERMRSFFPGLQAKKVRDQIREDIGQELKDKGIAARIPPKLFEKVFVDLRKESLYLNQILPQVIQHMDYSLREDFLVNSGLERFYVESLEQDYFEEKGLDPVVLESLREGRILVSNGGGERI